MSDYPNSCPRNDTGHEPLMPRQFSGRGLRVDNYFPVMDGPKIQDEDGNVLYHYPVVWWPCKHCGLVFWEPLEVAKRKAAEEGGGELARATLGDYVPCQACGWSKSRAPTKDEESPIVRGALDAQEQAEIRARAAKAAAKILGEAFGCEHKGNNVDWRSVAIDVQQVLPGKIES